MDIGTVQDKSLLIAKHLLHTISETEKAELEVWLLQSEENRKAFERICSEHFIIKRKLEAQMFDPGKGYTHFRQARHLRPVSGLSRWLRLVAAGMLLVLTSGTLIFILTRHTTPEASSLPVNHGFPQARLTLADGQIVEFSGKQQNTLLLNGARLTASGEKIEYTTTGTTRETDYNTLEVPRKGEFSLCLSDGTRVWLNAESRLRYPVSFTEKQRVVYLEGEAFFDVQKDNVHPFIVKIAKRGEIGVTGTSFNVRSYADEEMSQITLVTGQVNLKNNRHEIALSPGEQGRISSGESEILKKKVNTHLYTSWKDGRFIFKEQPLEEIMKTIARWYDVDFIFADEQVKQVTFSGNLQRYDDFSKILNMLETIRVARFEIKDKSICIYEYKKAN